MSQGLTNTKRRIQSITSTKKITKAMELVATVKLKRWKDSMENISSYLKEMRKVISLCADLEDVDNILEMKKYPNAKGDLYILVTSSLGLCGGYNYNIFKFINKKIFKDDRILIIGTKGFSKFSHENFNIDSDYVSFLDKFDYSKVINLREKLLELYNSGNYKSIRLISTTYKNSLTFIPEEITLLPIENLSIDENKKNNDIIFDPNNHEVLTLLIPKYLNTILYGRLNEAMVCEQASRRNAMDNANDNAEELLEKLKIEFNKARQAAITQEITEVVSGANK